MTDHLKDTLSSQELTALSSIVQIGEEAYRELMEEQLGHPYFRDVKGRLRTKFVQIQCEMESKNDTFPFHFLEREFPYNQRIPELSNGKVLLHIARTSASDVLPYFAKYKCQLSNRNFLLQRQLIIDNGNTPPTADEPFYGMLVFGGRSNNSFATIQFPAPGWVGIADYIDLPLAISKSEPQEEFERKKASLKKEFMARMEEVI